MAGVEIDSSTKTQRVSVFLSKLPVYILYIFNWIPWKPDSKLLLAFTLMLHVTGLVVSLIFVVGVVGYLEQSNSMYDVINVPKMLQYCSISPVCFLMTVVYVYCYSQWKQTTSIVHKISELSIFRECSSKHIVAMITMVCHGILSTFCISYFVAEMILREENMHVVLQVEASTENL